jgi:hypothetical protein
MPLTVCTSGKKSKKASDVRGNSAGSETDWRAAVKDGPDAKDVGIRETWEYACDGSDPSQQVDSIHRESTQIETVPERER